MLEALDRNGGLLTVLIEDFEDQARAHPGPAGRVMCGLIQAQRTQAERPARHLWYSQHCLRGAAREARPHRRTHPQTQPPFSCLTGSILLRLSAAGNPSLRAGKDGR